jgi:hypothetical protein
MRGLTEPGKAKGKILAQFRGLPRGTPAPGIANVTATVKVIARVSKEPQELVNRRPALRTTENRRAPRDFEDHMTNAVAKPRATNNELIHGHRAWENE